MKKKFVLMIAIVLVATTVCALLVGCAPKTPADFMEKWSNSSTKAIINDKLTVQITENAAFSKIILDDKGEKYQVSYMVMNGEKIDVYLGYKASADAKMGWEAETLTKEEFEEYFNVEFTDFTNMMKAQYAKVIDELNKVFADNFTKEKGVYVGNKDTDYEGTTIKITAKEMIMTEKIDEEKSEEFKFVIGCDEIVIPDDAKEALAKTEGKK